MLPNTAVSTILNHFLHPVGESMVINSIIISCGDKIKWRRYRCVLIGQLESEEEELEGRGSDESSDDDDSDDDDAPQKQTRFVCFLIP